MPRVLVRSLDDPRLDPFRRLPERRDSRATGYVIAESGWVVERLLASRLEVASVLVSPRLVDRIEPLVPPGVPLLVLADDAMRQVVGYQFHRGVLACARRPAPVLLEDVLPAAPARLTVLACPVVVDPENVGGLLRAAAAFRADAVLLGPRCPDPYSRRVLRVSMAAVLRVPLVESFDPEVDLARLRDEWDATLVATVAGAAAGAVPLPAASRPDRLVVLLGSEGHGLEPRWLDLCDRRVTIPTSDRVDSLNVATAAAICLYHYNCAAAALTPPRG